MNAGIAVFEPDPIPPSASKLIMRFTLADGTDFMHHLRISAPYVSEVCGYGWGHPIIDPADFGNPPGFGGYDPGDFGYPDPETNARPVELRWVSDAYYAPIEPFEPWYAEGRTDFDIAAFKTNHPTATTVSLQAWGSWYDAGSVGTEPIAVVVQLCSATNSIISSESFSTTVSSVLADVTASPPYPFDEIVTDRNSPQQVTLMTTATINLTTFEVTLT